MGKAKIIGNIGDGRYRVEIDYYTGRLQVRKQALEAKIIELTKEIIEVQQKIEDCLVNPPDPDPIPHPDPDPVPEPDPDPEPGQEPDPDVEPDPDPVPEADPDPEEIPDPQDIPKPDPDPKPKPDPDPQPGEPPTGDSTITGTVTGPEI